MTDPTIPSSINVPTAELAALAVECWRLRGALGDSATGAARHALRKMEDFLRARQIEAQSLDGSTYTAGMAAKVLDAIDDPKLPPGRAVVEQTVSPLIFCQGVVIKDAEIITRRSSFTGETHPRRKEL